MAPRARGAEAAPPPPVAASVGVDHTEPGVASYMVVAQRVPPSAAVDPACTSEAVPGVEVASVDIAGEGAFVDKEEHSLPHFCREMPAEEAPLRHHSSPE